MKLIIQILFALVGFVALSQGDFINFTLFGTAASALSAPTGNLFAIVAIAKSACTGSRAGIAIMWATECANVTDLTFDVNRQVDAITLASATTWKKIEFEKDTAFLQQDKTRNKSSINVSQQIQFFEPSLNNTVRNALEDLNGSCCMHVIVKDNAGLFHYCGISYNPTADTYDDNDMKTGEGSSNTGADPTADAAQYTENITCNSNFYAPFFAGDETDIVVV